MRCPYKNPDYRKHWNAHRRALSSPQRVSDNKGSAYNCLGPTKVRSAYTDLIRYGEALGRSRGLLPENLNGFRAWGVRHDDGTGIVSFTPGEYTQTSYFSSEFTATGPAVHVRMANLNWVPAPATRGDRRLMFVSDRIQNHRYVAVRSPRNRYLWFRVDDRSEMRVDATEVPRRIRRKAYGKAYYRKRRTA